MPTVIFGRAVRKGTHVIITAYGESGCGKTYSLIKLGRGLVGPEGKLGLLDTETGRGLIYANVAGGYEYAELTPQFTPERYIEAIDAAEAAGIEALIIDSGSHEWEGIGGILEMADAQTSRSGSELSGLVKWAKPKARHKKYVGRLLGTRMHLLISLRAKEKMIQITDKMPIPKGAKLGDIISDGFVPIQDKRFIFETTVQLFLPTTKDRNKLGVPIVEKCPEDLWGAFPEGERISEDTGRKIAEWVGGGAPIDHDFERLKRDAQDAAGKGIEALRAHWRTLDRSQRERLSSQEENLSSIARTADQDQEDRRRERETSHTAFGPGGDRGDPHPHSPAGTGNNATDISNTERTALTGSAGTLHAAQPPLPPAGDTPLDLLGDKPARSYRVRLPERANSDDWVAWETALLAMIEAGDPSAAILRDNKDNIAIFEQVDEMKHNALIRALGG